MVKFKSEVQTQTYQEKVINLPTCINKKIVHTYEFTDCALKNEKITAKNVNKVDQERENIILGHRVSVWHVA